MQIKKIRLNILLKWSKKASYRFFFTLRTMFYLPFIFIFLLIHNFSYFPSSIFLFPPPQFYYFLSPSTTTFTLYIFPSTKKSTSCRPYNDPRLNFVFQHSCVNSETIYNHHHISIVFSPLTHFCCFYSTTTFLLFPSSSTTFLLFSSIDLLFAFGLFGLWLPLLACVWPVTF